MVICRRSSLELSGSCMTLIRFSPLLPSAVFLSCSMLWSSSLLHPAHLAVFSDRHRQLLIYIYIYTVVRSSSEWMTCWTSFSSFICCFTLPSLPYPLICYFPLPLPISVFPLLFRLFCFSFSLSASVSPPSLHADKILAVYGSLGSQRAHPTACWNLQHLQLALCCLSLYPLYWSVAS